MTGSTTPSARTADTVAVVLDLADEVVVRCVRDVHAAVLRTTVSALPRALPGVPLVAGAHRVVSGAVYASVSQALRAGGRAARHASRNGVGAPVEQTPRSRRLRSVLNAGAGDRLAERHDRYALSMTVRSRGGDVRLAPESLRGAYPEATDELVVFVHGLGESDESWLRRHTGRGSTYAEEVLDAGVATPVILRYNTGRHVSDSGADLSAVLGRLVEAWPQPVRRIHLVGHSMGGLVIRSAAAQATTQRSPWVGLVATLVSLGTPHRGAPLEQAVHLASNALHVAGPSRPFAELLDQRSAGIVDLRHGHTSASDWRGRDLARQWGAGVAPLAPLPHVDHHFVVAAALPGPDTPLSRWIGDLVVPVGSASGVTAGRALVPTATVHQVRGTHPALLNHPAVAVLLRSWLR